MPEVHEVFPSWPHQEVARRAMMKSPAVYLNYGMGTGKTKATIDASANLGEKRVLVVCPSTVTGVWRRELGQHWHPECGEYEPVIPPGGRSVAKRVEYIHNQLAALPAETAAWVVVNYESVWRPEMAQALGRIKWDAVVTDEAHRIKTHNANVSKYLHWLAKAQPWARRVALSGTPMPHSPLDVFSQFKFLDKAVFGDSFYAFRGTYAVTDRMFPSRVLRFMNLDQLRERFESRSLTCRADDVLDLPEIVHVQHPVEMSARAKRIADQLTNELAAEIEDGVVATAPIVLTKLLRLQQLTGGFLVAEDADERRVTQRIGHEKADALAAILEEVFPGRSKGKDQLAGEARAQVGEPERERVVVFCRFHEDMAICRETAEKLNLRVGEVSGNRKDLTEHAQIPDEIDVMVAQISSGGVGIDFTKARYGVYYSMGYSLGEYDQSVARLHRPGQTRKTVIKHLVASGTVDEKVYDALRRREEVVQSVVGSITGVTA